ncbi:MAG: hypothetical protein ACI8PZ_002997 [Myxococcota bacterium]
MSGRPCILWIALAASACGGEPTPKPAPEDTGAETPPPVLADGCEVADDNALRLRCTGPEGAWVEAGGRRWEVVDGVATVALLPPETDVEWAIVEASGARVEGVSRTGALPFGLDAVLDGALPERSVLGMAVDCGALSDAYVVLVDPALPAVVWYTDLDVAGPIASVTGISWDGPDLWALAGRDTVLGVALDGTELGRFTRPDDFPNAVHHDLVWRDGGLYALDAAVHGGADGQYVLDGIVRLDAGARTWSLADHIEPTGGMVLPGGYWSTAFGPNVIDWSHANTLVSDGDGWLVSFRHLDAVVRLAADGSIAWVLGAPDSPLGSSFTWTSPLPDVALDLRGQHHATRLDDGRLLVFDNRHGGPSRVVAVRLDGDQAVLETEWWLDRGCPVQGGAFALPDGGVLATCSSEGLVVDFGPDGGERGRLAVSCRESGRQARGLIRAVPVQGLP